MSRANSQRRLYLQDALLRCRSEFIACAAAENVDNEVALLLAGQLFELETRLDKVRRQMSVEASGPDAHFGVESELCVGL